MNCYYVEGWSCWFVVKAKNKRKAYSEGVKEFGRGNVKDVRLATQYVEWLEVQVKELSEEITARNENEAG